VIAGPAEGWQLDETGRVVGQHTRRPVVRLDDLVVALRVFAQRGRGNAFVGCSIDQTEEGVRRFNQSVARLQSAINRRQVDASVVQNVRDSGGLQNIQVWGVPPDSRLALVLVEADYRMKLIGMNLEKSHVRSLMTYYSIMGPGDVGNHKLQRWWFVPDYEAINASDNRDAFELLGQRAKLVGADDKLLASGQVIRSSETSASGITKRFTQSFSSHFSELARINLAFAELQNVFDLIVISALIDDNDMIRAAPDLRFLLEDQHGYEPDKYPAPRHVECVVNTKWIGAKLAIGIGGGVVIDAKRLLRNGPGKDATNSKLDARRQHTPPFDPTTSRWWTD